MALDDAPLTDEKRPGAHSVHAVEPTSTLFTWGASTHPSSESSSEYRHVSELAMALGVIALLYATHQPLFSLVSGPTIQLLPV